MPRFLHRKHTDATTTGKHDSTGESEANGGNIPRYLQAKLAVSQPGDPQEQQADQVAEQVIRMPQAETLQGATGYGNTIQRKADAASGTPGASVAPDALSQSGPGQPLDGAARAYFEPRFGQRFDHVRTHTDTQAAQLNRTLGARAIAHGTDIYFAAGHTPRNDALTAHELTHVVQQQGAQGAGIIQRSPEPDDSGGAAAETGSAALIREAREDMGEEGAAVKFMYLPAELDGNAVFILFDDFHVQRLFRYLMRVWLGASGTSESLENTVTPAVPQWVGEFRAKALNLRAARSQDPDYTEQQQLAELALRLADSVQAETAAQSIRRRFVQEIDNRIGTTVMTEEDIAAERAKPATEGLTPANFTTCIVFFGQVMNAVMLQSGLKGSLVKGPNYYKEINPWSGKGNLPPGAWHPCTPDTRPKPGDLLIFSFTQNEVLKNGTQVYKDGFAHITIMRAIEPLRDAPADLAAEGYTEKFVTVDGGDAKATETVRYFAPQACLIKGPGTIVRKLRGWIDVEKAAEARLRERTPVQG